MALPLLAALLVLALPTTQAAVHQHDLLAGAQQAPPRSGGGVGWGGGGGTQPEEAGGSTATALSTGAEAAGGPTVTAGPSTLWANVRQLQTVTVRGAFKPGANLSCRVVDAPYDGTNFCPFCTSPAEVPRPARVINATAATCAVAGSASGIVEPGKDAGHGGSPGFAAGSGMLQFSEDNRTWAHGGWSLDFEPLADAAIGRRPYFSNDSTAELIVTLGAALPPTTAVSICASSLGKPLFPCAEVSPLPDHRGHVLNFSLASLNATFNTTITVDFSAKSLGLSGSLTRRFVRVPPPGAEVGSVVVVDHRHRALRVNGELWVGRGFYWPATQTLSLEQEQAWMFYLAQQGVRPSPHSPPHTHTHTPRSPPFVLPWHPSCWRLSHWLLCPSGEPA